MQGNFFSEQLSSISLQQTITEFLPLCSLIFFPFLIFCFVFKQKTPYVKESIKKKKIFHKRFYLFQSALQLENFPFIYKKTLPTKTVSSVRTGRGDQLTQAVWSNLSTMSSTSRNCISQHDKLYVSILQLVQNEKSNISNMCNVHVNANSLLNN